MSESRKVGSTDQSVTLRVTTIADGLPKGDLAYDTASLTAYYIRNGGSFAKVAITLVSLASASASHTDGGFIVIDADQGLYRLDLPDACLVNGVPNVTVGLSGISTLSFVPVKVNLTTFEEHDSTDAVDTLVLKSEAASPSTIWANATRTLTEGTKDSEIDAILVDTGTTIPGLINGLNDFDPTVSIVETGVTYQAALQDILAVLSNDSSGGGVEFLSRDGNTIRMTLSSDASGNRTFTRS